MRTLIELMSSGESQVELEQLSRYAQMELQHRQIVSLLESTAEDERLVLEDATAARRKTLFPFAGLGKKYADAQHAAKDELESIRLRIAQERKVIVDSEHHVHHLLHVWLMAHDPVYQTSAHIEESLNAIHSDIEPLAGAMVDLLARYGATRSEIAVSYDARAQMLSMVSLASLDRLIFSYELLLAEQVKFGGKIECLNALVEGGLYREMKLNMFNQLVPPDCRRGMDYAKLRENFEAGATAVCAAISQLQDYMGRIEIIPGEMSNVLYNYRDTLWRLYITELETGVAAAPGAHPSPYPASDGVLAATAAEEPTGVNP